MLPKLLTVTHVAKQMDFDKNNSCETKECVR